EPTRDHRSSCTTRRFVFSRPSSTPATVTRACRSNPTQLPSPIPAPPVIAALPPGRSRPQPAPTYERGAGHPIRSSRDGLVSSRVRSVECRHCGTTVVVQTCDECGREFALTVAHAEGRLRGFDEAPLSLEKAEAAPKRCDFCEAKARGESGAVQV